MKRSILLLIILFSVFTSHSQTAETILIGDSQDKARRLAKQFAAQDPELEYEEYNGWYGGINDNVNQYAVWGDGLLLFNVLAVDGKVVYIMAIMSDPSPTASQSELDQIKNFLRGKDAPPDHIYLQDNTYKKLMNGKFYSYCKYLVIYGDTDRIMPYIFDAYDFDALQRISKVFETEVLKKMKVRYL